MTCVAMSVFAFSLRFAQVPEAKNNAALMSHANKWVGQTNFLDS